MSRANAPNAEQATESAGRPAMVTVCCGLTLQEPVERWLEPLRRSWPGPEPRIRLATIGMLDQEPGAPAQHEVAGSPLLALLPDSEPIAELYRVVNHARRTARPLVVLCESVDTRRRAIADDGIVVEAWDIDPSLLAHALVTLRTRQPAVDRLSRSLDIAERLLSESSDGLGSSAAELQLAGLFPEALVPKDTPRFAGLELAIAHRAAGAVSHDLLDISMIDEQTIRVFAADVFGQGVAGMLLGLRLVRAVRTLGGRGAPSRVFHPIEALEELSNEVAESSLEGSPRRAAAMYGVLELHTGEFTCACAGFPAPLLVTLCGARRIGSVGRALGARGGLGVGESNTRIDPADSLLIASDGFDSALSQAGGLSQIEGLGSASASLESIGQGVERTLDAMPGSLHRKNDCTLLLLRINEPGPIGRAA